MRSPRICIKLVLIGFFVASISNASVAANKVALIIGNSEYASVGVLPNPVNDASAIAASFGRLGFDVTTLNNASRAKMRESLADFSDKAAGADVGVVFYAGHGIEVDRQNYLIPIDARLKTDNRIRFEAVPLDDVMAALDGVKGLRMVLLDACRDNPFAETMKRSSATRSIGRGLGRVEPAVGTLVSFAAKEGTTASDGEGRHSPYTTALLNHLEQPGLEVNFMFRKVRDSVFDVTGGKQEPFTYGSLPGRELFLKAALPVKKPEVSPSPIKPPKPAKPQSNSKELEALFWESVRNTDNPAMIEAYMDAYPQGIFKQLALLKLKQLGGSETKPAAPKSAPPETVPNDDADKKPDVGGDVPKIAPPPSKQTEQVSLQTRALPVGKWPEGLAVTANAIWVAESGQRTIARLNKGTSNIQRTKVGRLPVDMVSDSKNNIYSLVNTDKKLWKQAENASGGKTFVQFREHPEALINFKDEIWVITWPDGSSGTLRFHKIDPDQGLVFSSHVLKMGIDFQAGPLGYAVDQSRLWVAFGNGELIAFDKLSFGTSLFYKTDQVLIDAAVTNDTVAAGGFYRDRNNGGKIVILDAKWGTLISEHSVSQRISAITAADGYYIAIGQGGLIWILDAVSGKLLREITPSILVNSARDIVAIDDFLLITTHTGQAQNGQIAAVKDWKPKK